MCIFTPGAALKHHRFLKQQTIHTIYIIRAWKVHIKLFAFIIMFPFIAIKWGMEVYVTLGILYKKQHSELRGK